MMTIIYIATIIAIIACLIDAGKHDPDDPNF